MINLNKDRSYYKRRTRKIRRQEQNWAIEKVNLQRQNDIKNEYTDIINKKPRRITTGKLAMWFLFILCLGVIIFTGYITLKEFTLAYTFGLMPDFTPLVTMIGAIIGATIDVAAYFAKSTKENTRDGIIFEAAAANNFEKKPQDRPLGTEYYNEPEDDEFVG